MGKVKMIYISADDCGACVDFSSKWQSIREKLKQKVEIVEFILKTRRDCVLLPKGISEYVGWFPTFLLQVDDRTEIFNGQMIDERPDFKEVFPRSLEGFQRWITLHTGISFKKENKPDYVCYAISALTANVLVLNVSMWFIFYKNLF